MQPCPLRPIRPIAPLNTAGFRIKVYSITLRDQPLAADFESASRAIATERLEAGPTSFPTNNVGFLGIHQGLNENQVFLDLWINESELHHTVWVSPVDDPTNLTLAPDDFNSVCVWDLAVQAFERTSWLAHVLRNPTGPDLDRYINELMSQDV